MELRNQKQIAIINKIQILERATLNNNRNHEEIDKELKPFDDQIDLLNIKIKEQEDIANKVTEDFINYTLDKKPTLYI